MIGIVKAVCTSEKKGTVKKNVGKAVFLENHGLVGDAHAGTWHRQGSLLSWEKIEAFKALGVSVDDGDFGENLVVSGVDFARLPLGSIFQIGDAKLVLTQIGKECHHGCAIAQAVGKCIMPTEGVFAKVIKGGKVKVGDRLEVITEDEHEADTL